MARTKERIVPPSKAGKGLQKTGSSEDARILAELSVAKRQRVKPRKKP
jgi:hypothetical protein